MGSAQSNTKYPGITYCDDVAEWRKSPCPDSLSLLFLFENSLDTFSPEAASKFLTQKCGDSTFDGMRVLHTSQVTTNGKIQYMTVVEAHFLRATDRQKVLRESLRATNNKSDEKAFNKLRPYASIVISKAMPYIPLKPFLSVYTIDGLPLGSYWEKYNVVKKTVINVLFHKEKCASVTMDDIEDMHFVDIAQGKSGGKYFDGSVTIILKDVVNLNQKDLQFEEYGKTFTVSKHGVHFLYCRNCTRLDSHSEDECPFPSQRKRLQYH